MRIIRAQDIPYQPASHENQSDPGVLKKVLLRKKDLSSGHIQMINWAKLLPHKSFQLHYHEAMEEVFLILSGHATIQINDEKDIVGAGDTVIIPSGATHTMVNYGDDPVEYIAVGISLGEHGKTVVVTQEPRL